jgi:hypothetical protein
MSGLTKAECLRIEDDARRAIGRMYGCSPECRKIRLGKAGAIHEFDIYSANVVIGGVSTSPLTIGQNNRNTGGTDRASRELLWLSLWPGNETRVHVLTDRALAQWLYAQFRGVAFPYAITIYHYDLASDVLNQVGTMASTQI